MAGDRKIKHNLPRDNAYEKIKDNLIKINDKIIYKYDNTDNTIMYIMKKGVANKK